MKRKVIVVDDSSTARRKVMEVLEGVGYQVVEAHSADEGWKAIRAHENASLVICDINMPGVSGLELLGKAQSVPDAIPFLMLTSEAQPELIRQAKQLGARGWVVKPFKSELLVAAVNRLAERGPPDRVGRTA